MTDRKTILQGVVGSTAFGLATPESDIDRYGVWVWPTDHVLRRYENVERKEDSNVQTKPDVAMHEVGKFIRLAAGGRPPELEALFLPEHEILTLEGDLLVSNRKLFVSRKIMGSYVKFSKSLWTRTPPEAKKEKQARHAWRLLVEAEHLLRDGRPHVMLADMEADECRSMGKVAVDAPELFEYRFLKYIERLQDISTDLPERPDHEAIADLLVTIRRMNLLV